MNTKKKDYYYYYDTKEICNSKEFNFNKVLFIYL